jgi:H(+)-transporting ATP synthase subunit D
MKKVATTRMEMLARRAQLVLAGQARDLLERKRTALVQEMLQEADTAMQRSDILQRAAADAARALARAQAMAGPEVVRSAALAARDRLLLDVKTVNVMGIQVPRIEQKSVAHSVLGRGYSVNHSTGGQRAAPYAAGSGDSGDLAAAECLGLFADSQPAGRM